MNRANMNFTIDDQYNVIANTNISHGSGQPVRRPRSHPSLESHPYGARSQRNSSPNGHDIMGGNSPPYQHSFPGNSPPSHPSGRHEYYQPNQMGVTYASGGIPVLAVAGPTNSINQIPTGYYQHMAPSPIHTQMPPHMSSHMTQHMAPQILRIGERSPLPTHEEFEKTVNGYITGLSHKKRDKALIKRARYTNILAVLNDQKDTTIESAQFRHWAKKMFTLGVSPEGHQILLHEEKPVAVKEDLYEVLTTCHLQTAHGGRDKTARQVRDFWSW